MNWEQAEKKWIQLKALVIARWAKLTDNDLAFIAGRRDQLISKIQERYGIDNEEAERQVNEWNPAFGAQTAVNQPSPRKAG
jgi:uncharacterized protein YjbJ (UPF0337 family)